MDAADPRVAALMGELIAYRTALHTVIREHPDVKCLFEPVRADSEVGMVAVLAMPVPEEALDGFRRAVDEISEMLVQRANAAAASNSSSPPRR